MGIILLSKRVLNSCIYLICNRKVKDVPHYFKQLCLKVNMHLYTYIVELLILQNVTNRHTDERNNNNMISLCECECNVI